VRGVDDETFGTRTVLRDLAVLDESINKDGLSACTQRLLYALVRVADKNEPAGAADATRGHATNNFHLRGGGQYDAAQDYRFVTNLAIVGAHVVLNKAVSKQGIQAGGGFVFTTSWLEGEILVNNLSFVKNVGVRLSADGGISWNDTLGFFAGSHDADNIFIGPGADVWRFKTPELNLVSNPGEFRFAVFYRNGATGEWFWDNNFGQDYKISKADGATIR
jgi:Carbohydrate/starch-binding module (family 21)